VAFPGDITTTTVTGDFSSLAAVPQGGSVSVTYPVTLYDATGQIVIGNAPVTAQVSSATGLLGTLTLPNTDCPTLTPNNLPYTFSVNVPGASSVFSAYLPASYGETVDITRLAQVSPPAAVPAVYVSAVNGMSGWVVLTAAGVGAFPVSGGAFTGGVAPEVVTLADAPTILVDAALGNDMRVTLGGNRVLALPASPRGDGQKLLFEINQDSAGGRTLTLAAGYNFLPGLPSFTLTAAAHAPNYLGVRYVLPAAAWDVIAFL
jgi:hypothetical protein